MAAFATLISWLDNKPVNWEDSVVSLLPFPEEAFLQEARVRRQGCAQPSHLATALHAQQPDHCFLHRYPSTQ